MDENKLLNIKNQMTLDKIHNRIMRFKNQSSKINILYFHIEKHANFD